ncbi:hypothetical protein BACI71_90226 [Bacillus mycoides]|uniref:Uncharacterized protein n=1 Tax=Bacillus mycoides TaxID=1405 RepID=A0A654C7G2_BACMY|nr:hypothetical protein BACI71_90226 [Bacillus mycoides]
MTLLNSPAGTKYVAIAQSKAIKNSSTYASGILNFRLLGCFFTSVCNCIKPPPFSPG